MSDFIDNATIRKLISLAKNNIGNEECFDCIIPAKLAFMCAIKSVDKYIPVNYQAKYFHASNLGVFNTSRSDTFEMTGLKKAFDTLHKTLYDKIEDVEYLSIILSTGIILEKLPKIASI